MAQAPANAAEIGVIQERLALRLAELTARGARIIAEEQAPANPDWADNAAEHEQDEVLAREDALVAGEIASIRRALARIEDGSYGTCLRCGEIIAPARLAARPEAALCIDCARTGGSATGR